MRLISPTVELLRPASIEEGISALRFIESMARISHRSEDRQTEDSYDRFLRSVVLDHGDWSVVEHVSATAVFRVNRGVTHELVRHRLFSFTQESTRFVNGRKSYPNGLEFIGPSYLKGTTPSQLAESFEHAESVYMELLDGGMRPQEARSVLPNALAATIAVTGNLRNWRHFLIMRTTKETHPDFREVTIPLLFALQQYVPILFEDINPNERQADAIRKAR